MAVVTGGRSTGIGRLCVPRRTWPAVLGAAGWRATYLVRSIVPEQEGCCNGKVRFVCHSYVLHEVTLMTGFASFSRKLNHQERVGRAH
jgi:hypothetical protein